MTEEQDARSTVFQIVIVMFIFTTLLSAAGGAFAAYRKDGTTLVWCLVCLVASAVLAVLAYQKRTALLEEWSTPAPPPPPEPPAPLSELERRLHLARSIVEADRARLDFLRENNIPEGSQLEEQVNIIFSEYEMRLKE